MNVNKVVKHLKEKAVMYKRDADCASKSGKHFDSMVYNMSAATTYDTITAFLLLKSEAK